MAVLPQAPQAVQEEVLEAGCEAQGVAERCRRELRARGLAVVDNFFGDGGVAAARLRARALEHFAAGRMRRGVVRTAPGSADVEGATPDDSENARGDYVCWLRFDGSYDGKFPEEGSAGGDDEPSAAAAALRGTSSSGEDADSAALCTRLVVRMMQLVRQCVDPELLPSLLMPAVYPPGCGARFREHLDNPGGDGRVVTAVYYVNPGWRREQGGVLRAWTAGEEGGGELVEVLPIADRLVLFLADCVRHEVTPNERADLGPSAHRCAYTIWFYLEDEAVAHVARRSPSAGRRQALPVRRAPPRRRLRLRRPAAAAAPRGKLSAPAHREQGPQPASVGGCRRSVRRGAGKVRKARLIMKAMV